MSSIEERARRRKDWAVRKFDSLDDMRRQQVKDWQARSGAERRQAAWELARDYWVNI